MKVKLLHPNAKVPTRRIGDAGWDLYAASNTYLAPNSGHDIGLGIAFELPLQVVGIIKDRSSMASKGMHILAGVIDSSYRGEIRLVAANMHLTLGISLNKGEKIAQIIFIPVIDFMDEEIEVVEELSETERGEGGFGSTNNFEEWR
jgi:dUTP pyrophosphatase